MNFMNVPSAIVISNHYRFKSPKRSSIPKNKKPPHLPASSSACTHSARYLSMLGSVSEPLRALIVEDDLPLQGVLAQFLRSRGIVVHAVATVADGLERLRKHSPPHCLLLDLHLPDGDGTKILHHIRAKDFSTKVAIVTGTADQKLLAELMKLLPDKILKKPFGLRDVQEWLCVALDMPATARIPQPLGA
jgi:CheY-like chemotaxis protein